MKKLLTLIVVVGFILFLGPLSVMAKAGHGYDSSRLGEFGWRWDSIQNAYINEHSANTKNKDPHYDWYGFDTYGIHKDTHTRIDSNGYDWDGYTLDGKYDPRVGTLRIALSSKRCSHRGFREDGINVYTGTLYDLHGLDVRRFNKFGIHAHTKTRYDGTDPLWSFDVHGKNFFGDTLDDLEDLQHN